MSLPVESPRELGRDDFHLTGQEFEPSMGVRATAMGSSFEQWVPWLRKKRKRKETIEQDVPKGSPEGETEHS